MNIADKTLQLKKDFDDVYKAGQSSMVDESKIIEKTVSGEYISVDDVSEIPHEVKVMLTSGGNNKLPYPYVDTTKTVNGITFTDNGDGTITANGTSTNVADFMLQENFLIQEGMYITGIDGSDSLTYEIQAYTNQQNIITTNPNGNPQCKADFTATVVRLRIRSGVTLNNLVFKPMLSFTPNIPYEPYKEILTDYSGVSLTRNGKNLWSYFDSIETEGDGIIYTWLDRVKVDLSGHFVFSCFAEINDLTYSSTGNMIYLAVLFADGTEKYLTVVGSATTNGKVSFSIDASASSITAFSLTRHPRMTGGTIKLTNIMLEECDTATEYEPYNAQTLTANADGTVEGVKITSPYMYITTDNKNVTINATYHKSYGMQTEYDRFWESFQDFGHRTDYTNAFSGIGWVNEIFKPKYPIDSPLKYNQLFRFAFITHINYDLNLTKMTNANLVFDSCTKLVKIQKIITNENVTYTQWFGWCIALETIAFDGTIGKSIDFQYSTKLTKASILNIFSVLSSTVAGQTLTLSKTAVTNAFGSTTATEWTNLVATKTNWTISLV